jgi:RNA 2',3'-cyclic 3'-phosphodiesterase
VSGVAPQVPKARLFVALDLPEPARAAFAGWAVEHASSRDLRLVAPESLHLTLCFLGWREEADVERLGELVAPCAAPVREVSAVAASWLPPRRPRVLAIDLADPGDAVVALQRRVSDALEAAAAYEPESRPYRPHVTVARVRRGARVRAVELPPPQVDPFPGAALTLYRSRLYRAGPQYEPLRRVELEQ